MEIPMFIQRCLTYGVKIYPYQLKTVLLMAEKYKVPDQEMALFDHEKIEKYVKGLYLSGQEMAYDWTEGHRILIELGFSEVKQNQGHRNFVKLVYNSPVSVS